MNALSIVECDAYKAKYVDPAYGIQLTFKVIGYAEVDGKRIRIVAAESVRHHNSGKTAKLAAVMKEAVVSSPVAISPMVLSVDDERVDWTIFVPYTTSLDSEDIVCLLHHEVGHYVYDGDRLANNAIATAAAAVKVDINAVNVNDCRASDCIKVDDEMECRADKYAAEHVGAKRYWRAFVKYACNLSKCPIPVFVKAIKTNPQGNAYLAHLKLRRDRVLAIAKQQH